MAIDVRGGVVRDRARRTASGRSDERPAQPEPPVSKVFTLEGLLLCRGCGTSLQPMRMLGQRAYRGPCGCRLTAVDAEAIEQFVLETVAAPAPGLTADAAPEELGSIFRRLFVAVRVGGCAQDLSIVWRL
ncbi:zinc ribbon domain-containing protein [Micromonospora sp. WMMD980]|uniref:zinc ribbon domain-containing protein n=1 Tax=Micromonospora sp. WMMD980 TaxID=3016088 RepID=UPI0024162B16|nr:zinc ribbon domain-containing protein [Micromonospora sp. WMMD980]MDG4800501.1 zinc ribbon domain-containing protein [Micromonospora sp. WMMD980]